MGPIPRKNPYIYKTISLQWDGPVVSKLSHGVRYLPLQISNSNIQRKYRNGYDIADDCYEDNSATKYVVYNLMNLVVQNYFGEH